jgi:hypothetical protein
VAHDAPKARAAWFSRGSDGASPYRPKRAPYRLYTRTTWLHMPALRFTVILPAPGF